MRVNTFNHWQALLSVELLESEEFPMCMLRFEGEEGTTSISLDVRELKMLREALEKAAKAETKEQKERVK